MHAFTIKVVVILAVELMNICDGALKYYWTCNTLKYCLTDMQFFLQTLNIFNSVSTKLQLKKKPSSKKASSNLNQ